MPGVGRLEGSAELGGGFVVRIADLHCFVSLVLAPLLLLFLLVPFLNV